MRSCNIFEFEKEVIDMTNFIKDSEEPDLAIATEIIKAGVLQMTERNLHHLLDNVTDDRDLREYVKIFAGKMSRHSLVSDMAIRRVKMGMLKDIQEI